MQGGLDFSILVIVVDGKETFTGSLGLNIKRGKYRHSLRPFESGPLHRDSFFQCQHRSLLEGTFFYGTHHLRFVSTLIFVLILGKVDLSFKV